jgi:hypothetical protein
MLLCVEWRKQSAGFIPANFRPELKGHFFKWADQSITTDSDVASAMRLMKRKRCPSMDTS